MGGKWLAELISYTERTAQKLMLVFDAYGDKQSAALNASAQTQRLPNMNYSQALILLAVPEEEREQFIAEMDIENMSVRELQKAVKDRDRALQEKADLQKALDGEKGINTQLTKERDNLKTTAGDLQKSNRALEQDVEKKQLEQIVPGYDPNTMGNYSEN